MAYKRKIAGRARTRRVYSTRKTTYSRPRRTVARYRSKLSRKMSSRRILNISSKKKRDNMQPVQTDFLGAITGTGARNMAGDGRTTILWSPTVRAKPRSTDNSATVYRDNTTIFIKGLKEKINFRTDTAVSWRWRRVIFFVKGWTALIPGLIPAVPTTAGYTRSMVDISSAAATNVRNAIETQLFEGAGNLDWTDLFSAKIDTKRVTLYSDRTRILSSGNNNGKYFQANKWYPVNKNITYNDDEVGDNDANASVSTFAKPGIGDMYIIDFFECSSNSTNDHLMFSPEATLYWHEK